MKIIQEKIIFSKINHFFLLQINLIEIVQYLEIYNL